MTRLTPLLLILLFWPALAVHADSGASGAAPPPRTAPDNRPGAEGRTLAAPLVRILRLSGIGPDGREQQLFADVAGFETPIRELGRIGGQVDATGLADGSYHTLFVELADDFRVPQADGGYLDQRLSDSGQPRRLRISGMIRVENGQAIPLRMLHDTSYYAHPRGYGDTD